MNEPSTEPPDPRLAFLRQELGDDVDIAGDIAQVGDRWAIHGAVPLEGEVILGEYDTYDQARNALEQLARQVDAMTTSNPVLSTVGHDDGWLVLSFERRLGQPPDEVWHTLSSSEHREHGIPCGLTDALPTSMAPPMRFEWCPGPDTVRWEVDGIGDGSRLALTTWIESDDPDVAASAGAGYHSCFEQVVKVLDTSPDGAPLECTDLTTLTTQYLAAFAAAQADTD